MPEHSISTRNTGSLIALIVMSGSFVSGASKSGQDAWISVIIASVCALPLMLLYSRIVHLHPGLGFFDIIEKLFGKVIGKSIIALLTLYFLHLSTLTTRNFSEFTNVVSLEKTPILVIIAVMLAVAVYLARNGFVLMGKWSAVILGTVLFVFIMTFLMSYDTLEITNLQPVMNHSIGELVSEAYSFGVISFGETVLALIVFGSLKKNGSPFKAYFGGFLIGAIIIEAITLRNISVLGSEMMKISIFPSFTTSRIIHFGDFFEHVESIFSFSLVVMGITKISVCLRAISMGAAKLLNVQDDRRLLAPVALVSLAMCVFTVKNIQELLEFVKPYRYYGTVFLILIPAVIWIASEVQARRRTA